MSIDRATFFAHAKPLFSGGHLSQGQVDGMTALLDYWELEWLSHNLDLSPNPRWLAYILATAFHETGQTMNLGIEEGGRGEGKPYGQPDPVTHQVYYGRGPSQITWRYNYEAWGVRLGLDLLNKPDLACVPANALAILVDSMARGYFTGRRLGQYFGATPAHDDPVGARAIVNGSDRATVIASYHRVFLSAVQPPVGKPVAVQSHSISQGA